MDTQRCDICDASHSPTLKDVSAVTVGGWVRAALPLEAVFRNETEFQGLRAASGGWVGMSRSHRGHLGSRP